MKDRNDTRRLVKEAYGAVAETRASCCEAKKSCCGMGAAPQGLPVPQAGPRHMTSPNRATIAAASSSTGRITHCRPSARASFRLCDMSHRGTGTERYRK